jgi:hypothetical protein
MESFLLFFLLLFNPPSWFPNEAAIGGQAGVWGVREAMPR